MRKFISWIIGILLFFLMIMLQDFLSGLLGFATYVEYDETVYISHRFYDDEVDGHSTVIGLFFLYLSFLVAIRGGMAVFIGKINADVSKKDNFILLLIGIGLLKGGKEVQWSIAGKISLGWFTLPVIAALISLIILFILQNFLNLRVSFYQSIMYAIR